jgi:hypothetical protein
MAPVTDHAWMRAGAALLAPLTSTKIEVFAISELDAAKAWIIEAR